MSYKLVEYEYNTISIICVVVDFSDFSLLDSCVERVVYAYMSNSLLNRKLLLCETINILFFVFF